MGAVPNETPIVASVPCAKDSRDHLGPSPNSIASKAVQRPLPNDALMIVARGEANEGPAAA